MRVGVLEILSLPSRGVASAIYGLVMTKQFASVTPQAISVHCRRSGHETHYATYYGVSDPCRALPSELDIVFICSYTQASPLAYALAKLYRKRGARTVIGGPHARSFPVDCLRFFDIVVGECNESLLDELLSGSVEPGSVVSSGGGFEDFPTIEERMPEIRLASLAFRRFRYFTTTVPMLASVGCPYACNFCIDWDTRYRVLPTERLAADVEYAGKNLPGAAIAFHDPNFGVKFDRVLGVIENVAPDRRPPYIIESSLSVLRAERVERLRRTNCIAIAPGIESWAAYSNKAAVGRDAGFSKLQQVLRQFRHLAEHIPYLQANFLLGLDCDHGDEPFELTERFIAQAPFVWPTLNIPVPFGGTPLQAQYMKGGRILTAMPFMFYYTPFLATTLKHYEPVGFYEKLIGLLRLSSSLKMIRARHDVAKHGAARGVNVARALRTCAELRVYEAIRQHLIGDRHFRDFHEGRSTALPSFYEKHYERSLGKYASLLSIEERVPDLTPLDETSAALEQREAGDFHPARTRKAPEVVRVAPLA